LRVGRARGEGSPCYFLGVAAERITVNDEPITDRELRAFMEHVLCDLHDIRAQIDPLSKFATPDVLAALDGMLNSPAWKWKQRVKSGRT
jgi:hypothetical protein